MILIVTPLAAVALTVLYIKLTMGIVGLRHKHQISLGSAGNDELEKAIRAHANLAEWAPIGLILTAVLEINQAPLWAVAPPAIAFVAGRVLHPKGLQSTDKETLQRRKLGMQLTMYAVMVLAALNVLWLVFKFFTG